MPEAIATMSEIYSIVFPVTVAVLALNVPLTYWKIYLVYRAVGEQARRLGFFWFSFQFQSPIFARGMPNYLDLDSLPGSLRIKISGTRRQLRFVAGISVLWLFLVLAFGAATAMLGRHYS
jgi:hypothetical protein